MSSKSGQSGSFPETVTISVLGVSGTERVKGAIGVGKSLLCNRFIRGDNDSFQMEHSSILSQADFSGSPVINNDHWLYWGEATLTNDDLCTNANIRLIEQTEFVDDETFEALAGTGEDYAKRATRTKLESADKLMYICKEQLGLETEFAHQTLPDGRCFVDGFVYVYDLSVVESRPFDAQSEFAFATLQMALKSKKPIVIAASKADIGDNNGRKALQRLLTRKELKSANIPMVEVSAFSNVNVTSVFELAAALIEKWKVKPKMIAFADALNQQRKREREICERYVAVLRELMPIESWPQRRPTWAKLLNRIGLSRHLAYTHFVYVFGRGEAKKLYQRHVNEAREFWMQRRLQTQTPRLTHVFADLIGAERVRTMKWADAKEAICTHPLFDEYFQPLGALAADLDPSSPQIERNLNDTRIPAELLLTVEAEPTYYEFQRMVDREYRRERMEEQFEQALAQCAQVTPGKPLQEVEIFLRGNPAYDALPPQLAFNIYDRFQEILVKKAEADFIELLLERVQLFIDVVMRRRQQTHTMRPLIGLDDNEMSDLRSVLHEDARYRQLNRLFEFRDKMLSNYASFVSYPLVQNCPSGNRCVDTLLQDIFHSHLQRRQLVESSQLLHINLVLVGDEKLTSDFTFALAKMLCGDVLEHERGLAQIMCVREKEAAMDAVRTCTYLFLIDSTDSLEGIKSRSFSQADFGCPPLLVVVADAAYYDMLPCLHRQGRMLANSLGGIFVGVGSESLSVSRRASDNELNTHFTRDQMSRILDGAFSSQTDGRRVDARVQLSLMCGDQFPAQCVLNSLLSVAAHLASSSSGGMATVEVPIASLKRTARIDMRVSSYHSWLISRAPLPIHGHILAYSARRRASFAHAAAAAHRLIESSPSFSTKSILFIAVADVTDFFNDEETNALLTEGSELADKLSASFVTLSPEVAERLHTVTFVEFFERILCSQIDHWTTRIGDDSGEYATLSDANLPNSLHWTLGSLNTVNSDCTTASRESSCSHNSARLHSFQIPFNQRSNSISSKSDANAYRFGGSVSSQRCELPAKRSVVETSALRAFPVELSKAEIKQTAAAESAISFTIPPHIPFGNDATTLNMGSQHMAPLATPEHIEIASDYMTVKDALSAEDEGECAYTALDFSNSSTSISPLRDVNTNTSHRSQIAEKARNLIPRLPRRHATNNSSVAPSPQSKTSVTSPSGSMTSSSPTSTAHPSTGDVLLMSGRGSRRSVDRIAVSGEASMGMASACKPGAMAMHRVAPLTCAVHRLHSISAESLVDVGIINSTNLYGPIDVGESSSAESAGKKLSKSRFVRKMTSSFRFRRGTPRLTATVKKVLEEAEDEGEDGIRAVSTSGSRSVPHSPHAEGARLPIIKRRPLPSSSEKISNAFSWLPSRSPKRSARNANPETAPVLLNGVISSSDTLSSLAASSPDYIPIFIKKCIEYIEKIGGLEVEGLYRVPGNQAQVIQLERAFVADNTVDLQRLELPVHAVATALKNFLSGLPEPLIPYEMHDKLVACLDVEPSEISKRMRDVLDTWPTANRSTIAYFLAHLARVAQHADVNAMDVRNLAKVWWPTLFRPNFDTFESMAVFVARLEMATQLLIGSAAQQHS
uniref:Rho-GAP domain-containing protein n=4 Tax=Parascaris univalens TaxID=6257 RepID=A0A914ZY28_PARUN